MRIGVAGLGVVGKAMVELIATQKKLELTLYDPPQGIGDIDELNKCDMVFVCVPTPPMVDGRCDITIVRELVRELTVPITVIKSTVAPGTCRLLQDIAGKNTKIVFNPEFLRASHAVQDLFSTNRTIIGTNKPEVGHKVIALYKEIYDAYMCYVQTDWETAELIKYATNTYLANKVVFCNQLFDICGKLGIDYDQFREYWLLDSRIGRDMTIVGSERGYAGGCFPKDVGGFITMVKDLGLDSSYFEQIHKTNVRLRSKK